MSFTNCMDCNVVLNENNYARTMMDGLRDPESAYCETCYATHEEWVPVCDKCGTLLIQNEENLCIIECPSCKCVKIKLEIEN